MQISIDTKGATKRELLLVAGLFTSLADVTEYARTTGDAKIENHVEPLATEEFEVVVKYVPTPPANPVTTVGSDGVIDPSVFGAAPAPTTAPAVPLPPFVPPVPPAATAPSLPSAAGGGTDAPVERDTDQLPWDARIHAGTKRKNADGRWTAKKGLNDAAEVARVKAELLAGTPAPAPVAATPPPPPAYVPGAGVPVVPGHASSVPPVPPPPPAPVQGGPTSFAGLCMAMAPLAPSAEHTAEALRQVGCASLPLLGTQDAAKIPAFWSALVELVG